MSAGKQTDRQTLDRILLADNYPCELLAKTSIGIAQLGNRAHVIFVELVHRCYMIDDNRKISSRNLLSRVFRSDGTPAGRCCPSAGSDEPRDYKRSYMQL